jgi:O-6-methylguanine DNA methyltransferase
MSAVHETIHLTHFDTAFGAMSLASSGRGVVACSLPGDGRDRVRTWLSEQLPEARIVEGPGGASPSARRNASAVRAVRDYLAGRRRNLMMPLDLRGTDFQKKVWAALRRVPYGATISYGELAEAAGAPNAVRACGTANGSNPAPLFVPCHRVIASDGSLGGFFGGLPLKRRLLALESGKPLHASLRKSKAKVRRAGVRMAGGVIKASGANRASGAGKGARKPPTKPAAKSAAKAAARVATQPAAKRRPKRAASGGTGRAKARRARQGAR